MTVTAADKYGIATIWDYDVLIWAVSQINSAVDAGLQTSPRVSFHPYELLKATGRNTGGKGYRELKAALAADKNAWRGADLGYTRVGPLMESFC